MKNHIIPISVKPNSLSNDRITVGLMAVGNENKFFEYSYEKLKIVFSLIDDKTKKYLKESLASLRTSFYKEESSEHINLEKPLFEDEYLTYLSNYSNGLIEFGTSKGFSIELTTNTFEMAFKHFVGIELKPEKKANQTLRSYLNEKLKNNIFEKVDVKYTVDPDIVSGLYTSHRLDFIGVNGKPYAGLGIDFSKSPEDVDKDIIAFKVIVDGISRLAKSHNMESGRYEAYFNEPVGEKNILLLDKVNNDSKKHFELVEIDKFDKVIQKISDGNYIKFSESSLVESH